MSVIYVCAECNEFFPSEGQCAEHVAEHHPTEWEMWYNAKKREAEVRRRHEY
jgi:hypothetical protein